MYQQNLITSDSYIDENRKRNISVLRCQRRFPENNYSEMMNRAIFIILLTSGSYFIEVESVFSFIEAKSKIIAMLDCFAIVLGSDLPKEEHDKLKQSVNNAKTYSDLLTAGNAIASLKMAKVLKDRACCKGNEFMAKIETFHQNIKSIMNEDPTTKKQDVPIEKLLTDLEKSQSQCEQNQDQKVIKENSDK